jgi:F-type H+-transporting ATPase subunit a
MLNLGGMLASGDPVDHVRGHYLDLHLGPFHLTNQMVMALLAAVLMLVIFPLLFRKPSTEPPRGLRNFFEAILQFLRDDVFRPALKEHADRFVPFLWTLFIFILFCNLLGQLPVGELLAVFTRLGGGHPAEVPPVWGTATGSLATTGALALVAFFFIHASGIWQVTRSLVDGTYGHGHGQEHDQSAEHGHGHGDGHGHEATGHSRPGMAMPLALLAAVPVYLWNFAPHPFKPGPGDSRLMWLADAPLFVVLLALELLGAVIKPFALMMRLFANMIAGHIVLAALIALIPVGEGLLAQLGYGTPVTVLSLLVRALELFVSFLQAYIFTFLTTLFLAGAVAPDHG